MTPGRESLRGAGRGEGLVRIPAGVPGAAERALLLVPHLGDGEVIAVRIAGEPEAVARALAEAGLEVAALRFGPGDGEVLGWRGPEPDLVGPVRAAAELPPGGTVTLSLDGPPVLPARLLEGRAAFTSPGAGEWVLVRTSAD